MENYNDWTRRILLIAGVVEIVVGLSHFAMPYYAYQAKGFTLLNQDERNFITLCVFAVGILLMAFGILTVFFSLRFEAVNEMLLYYVIIKSVLWLGRIILEISYPVKVALFYIGQPTMVVMPLLIFEWLLFVFSAVLIAKIRRMSDKASAVEARKRSAG